MKSLKTSVGSIIAKPEDINVVLAEMQKFRSTIEGGVCARRINSPFFSVDVADRVDGVPRVVEIGDGQVSDLVGRLLALRNSGWNDLAAKTGAANPLLNPPLPSQ